MIDLTQYHNDIIHGNTYEVIKQFPDKSINCLITSPPYYQARNYDVDDVMISEWFGKLGWEETPDLFVEHLADLFDEMKRVLTDDGIMWINLGDGYSGGSTMSMSERMSKNDDQTQTKLYHKKLAKTTVKFQQKSLMGIPFRFAIEMLNRGWILRNVIVWHKPDAQPSSVKDRFTIDYEYIFFFVKQQKYYFEQQFEPLAEATKNRMKYNWCKDETKASGYRELSGLNQNIPFSEAINPKGRNKRCIWSIPTTQCKEAHFATFPESLVEQMILPGCPEGGIVLDPFAGTGTTIRVAERMNRIGIGIELSEEYIKMFKDKLQEQQYVSKSYLGNLEDYY